MATACNVAAIDSNEVMLPGNEFRNRLSSVLLTAAVWTAPGVTGAAAAAAADGIVRRERTSDSEPLSLESLSESPPRGDYSIDRERFYTIDENL